MKTPQKSIGISFKSSATGEKPVTSTVLYQLLAPRCSDRNAHGRFRRVCFFQSWVRLGVDKLWLSASAKYCTLRTKSTTKLVRIQYPTTIQVLYMDHSPILGSFLPYSTDVTSRKHAVADKEECNVAQCPSSHHRTSTSVSTPHPPWYPQVHTQGFMATTGSMAQLSEDAASDVVKYVGISGPEPILGMEGPQKRGQEFGNYGSPRVKNMVRKALEVVQEAIPEGQGLQ